MAKYKLKLGHRLALMQILPQEGNITTLRIISDLRKNLGLTEADHAKYGVKIDGGNLVWDGKKDIPVDIEIGPVAEKLISRQLRDLNKGKKLGEQHLPLWEMFCEKPKPAPDKKKKGK